MALALYRKYRPKSFAQMHGHDAIVTVLRNASAQDRIGHAYLFCGVRGTGKTTAARLLAKAANCYTLNADAAARKKGEPCNACDACAAIDSGTTMDVIEIDAASNRRIDEMREIKEAAQFMPSYFRYKVFIVDEAHALTRDAAGALLKLLEEPPAHAIFILATTEPEKLLPTIVSRTQRFDFKKLSSKHIEEKLRRVAEEEGIDIDAGALHGIALGAEGSMRDAESMLDQIVSFGTKRITIETIEDILGRVTMATLKKLVDAAIDRDSAAVAALFGQFESAGYDAAALNKDLLRYLRRVFSLKLAPDMESAYAETFSKEELGWFHAQAARADTSFLSRLIPALIEAQRHMRYAPEPLLLIEVVIAGEMGK